MWISSAGIPQFQNLMYWLWPDMSLFLHWASPPTFEYSTVISWYCRLGSSSAVISFYSHLVFIVDEFSLISLWSASCWFLGILISTLVARRSSLWHLGWGLRWFSSSRGFLFSILFCSRGLTPGISFWLHWATFCIISFAFFISWVCVVGFWLRFITLAYLWRDHWSCRFY